MMLVAGRRAVNRPALATPCALGHLLHVTHGETPMVLPVRDQVRYWAITAALFLLLLWAVGDVLVPFVLGGPIAYLLEL